MAHRRYYLAEVWILDKYIIGSITQLGDIMLKCICGKEFETYRQLNGHKSVHSRGEDYTNSRKKEIKTYNCRYCGKTNKISIHNHNIYCNNRCQGDYTWKLTKEKIENGTRPANKKYIIEKFGNTCSECGLGNIWNGRELSLQLDHIDGNSDNNDINNLRILCPNCHTQTDTFGSKRNGSGIKKITKRNMYLRNYQSSEIIGIRTATEADRNSKDL